MQKIDGTTIMINRGDVLNLTLTIKDDEDTYTFQVGDTIKFSVYGKNALNLDPVLTKTITIDAETTTAEINLSSADTKIGEYLNKPIDYWYEVELNGQYTVIGYDESGAKIFKLFPEGYQL
jgi:hypothetical protein